MAHDGFDNEGNEPITVLHASNDQFETTMYGQIDVTYLVFPGQSAAGNGAVVVTRRVPYGMAMTNWRNEMVGMFPVPDPFTLH